jgi:hypothetical protein
MSKKPATQTLASFDSIDSHPLADNEIDAIIGVKKETVSLVPIHCPFVIISDTREQSPYTFAGLNHDVTVDSLDHNEVDPYSFTGLTADSNQKYAPLLVKTVRIGLGQGDYAVFGLPGLVVERKSKADLFGSVVRRANFIRRLELMTELKRVAFVVVEAELSEILRNPPEYSKLSPKSLSRTIIAWMTRYPLVHWLFLPDRDVAEAYTFRILERWYRDHQTEMVEAWHQDPLTGERICSIPPAP